MLRPHAVPRWGVCLENGDQAIMLEETAVPAGKPDADLDGRWVQAYRRKYARHGYSSNPGQWDEGRLDVFTASQCLAWTSFSEDPTKFLFED